MDFNSYSRVFYWQGDWGRDDINTLNRKTVMFSFLKIYPLLSSDTDLGLTVSHGKKHLMIFSTDKEPAPYGTDLDFIFFFF